MRGARGVVLAAACAPLLGCALLSRGEKLDVHWYTPERTRAIEGSAELQGTCELRLGRVTSGADLGPRIAFGDGRYEVAYHDAYRWTERPEHYVRRALGRTLFEEGAFRRSVRGDAPTLDVELVDFEEVKTQAFHAARIAVRIVLTTDRVKLERTVVVVEPVAGEPFEEFVAAMARALERTAGQVASATIAAAECGCNERR